MTYPPQVERMVHLKMMGFQVRNLRTFLLGAHFYLGEYDVFFFQFSAQIESVCVCVCVCVSQSVSKTHSPQTMIEQLKDRLR